MLPAAKYAIRKDEHDEKDYISELSLTHLPPMIDMRPQMPPVVDQGELGSCTANAIACGLMEYLLIKGGKWQHLSRLFLYWHERYIEGTIKEDAGAMIRDGMRVLQKIGVCEEVDFPYLIDTFAKTPSAKAEADATDTKIATYHRITTLNTAKAALTKGYPIVMGFTVYDSFESADVARTGVLPVSIAGEQDLGGHAVLIVGYDDSKQHFIVRNSWGTSWGDKGYFYMPYSYLTQGIIQDMWIGS